MNNTRTLVWFSCGAASACAAKLAVQKYGNSVNILYCDTLVTEHPDNARFMSDVSHWIGRPIQILRSNRYANINEVFEKTRYMAGIGGARCTTELKKIPRFAFQAPDDLHIFGLTADESKRISRFELNNPELLIEWNLRDAGIRKSDCYDMLIDAKIELPAMYKLGFKNNNCIGCVKATSITYWQRVRKHFPNIFELRAKQSRELGCKLTRLHGVRIYLDELPDGVDDASSEDDIECGPLCGIS